MNEGKRLDRNTPNKRVGRYQPRRLAQPEKRAAGGRSRVMLAQGIAVCGLLCSLAVCSVVDLTAAYQFDEDNLHNRFALGDVTPQVVEDFDKAGRVKRNVAVSNGGNTPVYVRAALLITWEDGQGRTNLLLDPPALGTDYTLDLALTDSGEGWRLGSDGYYYYTRPVAAGKATGLLVRELTDLHGDADRQLNVDVIAQAVQAEPTQAVRDAFPGVSIADDGTLTPPMEGGGAP